MLSFASKNQMHALRLKVLSMDKQLKEKHSSLIIMRLKKLEIFKEKK